MRRVVWVGGMPANWRRRGRCRKAAGQADYILLPMPMDAEAADLARILRAARPGTLALGGRISEPVRKAAQAAGVELVDYFLRPELACLNAVPTAEGCLALLMQLRQRTIWEYRNRRA